MLTKLTLVNHLLALLAATGAETTCRQHSAFAANKPNVPTTTLRNGIEMPQVAIGTLYRDFTKTDSNPSAVPGNPNFFGFLPEKTYRALTVALELGYTHIDAALVYRTQKAIGSVLAAKMMTGEISRDDIFITSKIYHGAMPGITRRGSTLPLDDMTPDEVADAVEEQFEAVLEELGVGYVDIMLMHWPAIMDSKDEGNAGRRLAAWKVFERMHDRGLARAIGVSNFSEQHIEQLMIDGAKVLPHVNQIEASVYKSWDNIKTYCDEKGIKLMAYSPLGLGKESLLNDPVVKSIAEAKGVAPSQVALKYLVQQGYTVLPMSSSEGNLMLNLNLFSFELTDKEMERLGELSSKDEGIGLPSPYDMS